jgi:hypothetical protein
MGAQADRPRGLAAVRFLLKLRSAPDRLPERSGTWNKGWTGARGGPASGERRGRVSEGTFGPPSRGIRHMGGTGRALAAGQAWERGEAWASKLSSRPPERSGTWNKGSTAARCGSGLEERRGSVGEGTFEPPSRKIRHLGREPDGRSLRVRFGR